LLKALLSSSDGYNDTLMSFLTGNDFRSGIAEEIFREMKLQAEEGYSSISLSAMTDKYASLCSSLLTDAEPLDSPDRERLMNSVEGHRLETKLRELSERLKTADDAEKAEIQEEIRSTGRELMKVKNAGETEL